MKGLRRVLCLPSRKRKHRAVSLPTSEQPGYIFKPLQNSNSIRILRLEPGRPNDDLHAQLLENHLSDHPDYEAVSYTWGEPVFPDTLMIDGLPFMITSNLHSALLQFRRLDSTRDLWVDVVCINQKDDIEKGTQIALMSTIYSQASTVLVWLGSGTEESDIAMTSLPAFLEDARRDGIEISCSELTPDEPYQLYFTNPAAFRKVASAADTIHFHALYTRSWFGRFWIMQEVALARAVVVHCGSHSIDWNTFDAAMELLRQAASFTNELLYDCSSFCKAATVCLVKTTYNLFNATSVMRIGYLSSYLYQQSCADDRDRVYALLGLAKLSYWDWKPAYNISIAELYQNFTRHCLSPDNIDFISLLGLQNHPHSRTPQTVKDAQAPDYIRSCSIDLRQSAQPITIPWHNLYFNADTTTPSFNFKPYHISSIQTLVVRVHRLDVVTTVLPVTCRRGANLFTVREALRNLARVLQNAKRPYDAPHDIELVSLLTAVNCSTVWNQYFGQARLPSEYLSKLYRLFNDLCMNESGEVAVVYSRYMHPIISLPRPIDASYHDTHFDFEDMVALLSPPAQLAFRFYQSLCQVLSQADIFLTAENYIGLAPNSNLLGLIAPDAQVKPGMHVVIVAGASEPYLVAKCGQEILEMDSNLGYEPSFSLIGRCYVNGIMGLSDRPPARTERKWENIQII